MNDEATPGRSGSATVRPFLLAPRDWQAIALREAADVAGTPECSAKMVESKRYAALADEIERLRARVLDLEAVHEDASGAILQAVAAERERISSALMKMHERDKGRHNYWHCAVVELFWPNAELRGRP